MANFIRKLVDRSRSKSPHKAPRNGYGGQHGGPPPGPAFYPWREEPQVYEKYNGDYMTTRPPSHHVRYHDQPPTSSGYKNGGAAPLCYLPLPASPLAPSRNSSRQSNNSGGATSNDSLGIKTWNTEKDEAGGSSTFFLNKGNDVTEEPRLFDDGSREIYGTTSSRGRTRSESPLKKRKDYTVADGTKTRSKSPTKKRTISQSFDYLTNQCHLEGCTASILVQNARFLVCRHQLTHASEYFRSMLQGAPPGAEVSVTVSGMACPSPVTQFKWFIESTIPYPALKDIGDDTLETCMRLSRRFESKALELRCNKYIIENASQRQPMVVMCWLNWCLQHAFTSQARQSCLPSVARLSLATLEQHRHMLTEKIFADIVSAKLRSCYDKCVNVFATIHRLDHFTVELDQCPRCGRQKEQGRVRVHAFPCRKLVGCERCTKELDCELASKAESGMTAFYQCPHALLPLNDTSEDCFCQITGLAEHLRNSFTPLRPSPHIDSVTPAKPPLAGSNGDIVEAMLPPAPLPNNNNT